MLTVTAADGSGYVSATSWCTSPPAPAIAVTGGPQPSSHAVHGQTVAYVTTRTQHALTVAQQGKLIEELHSVGHYGDFGFTVVNTAPSAQPWAGFDPLGTANP